MKTLITLILLAFAGTCVGQQLRYRPVNPAFGGDTFNYNWLLSSANSQNKFTEDRTIDEASTLDDFSDNLNRQILGQLSRAFFSSQLGDGLQAGNFSFGTLALEIFDTAEGLVINILDTSTGEQTQVVIPN